MLQDSETLVEKKRKLPGASLYKEQKRKVKDSQKSMSPPEKPKMCFNVQNVLPQCNLLMKQIEKVRPNEETEEYTPNERIRQNFRNKY